MRDGFLVHFRYNLTIAVQEGHDVFRRVLLLLKFRGEEHFREQRRKPPRGMTPGAIFLYLYKDVPKYDLELLAGE